MKTEPIDSKNTWAMFNRKMGVMGSQEIFYRTLPARIENCTLTLPESHKILPFTDTASYKDMLFDCGVLCSYITNNVVLVEDSATGIKTDKSRVLTDFHVTKVHGACEETRYLCDTLLQKVQMCQTGATEMHQELEQHRKSTDVLLRKLKMSHEDCDSKVRNIAYYKELLRSGKELEEEEEEMITLEECKRRIAEAVEKARRHFERSDESDSLEFRLRNADAEIAKWKTLAQQFERDVEILREDYSDLEYELRESERKSRDLANLLNRALSSTNSSDGTNGQYVADYSLKVDDHVNRVAGLRIWFHYKIRKLQLQIDKERENGAELQRLRNELERQREEMERLQQMHQEELASLENKLRELNKITEKLTAEALSEKKQQKVKPSQPDGMLALEERIKTLEESERRLQTENEELKEEIKKLRLAFEELKFQLEIERERRDKLEMGQRGEISESEESIGDDVEGRKETRKKRKKKRKESRKGFTRSIFLRLYEDARNRLVRLAELQKRVRAATMHELLRVLRGIEKAIDLFPIECLENVDKICEHVLLHLSGKEGASLASPYKQRSDTRPTTAGLGSRPTSRPTTAGVCSRPVTPMVRRCFSAKWDSRQEKEVPMILGSGIFSAKRL